MTPDTTTQTKRVDLLDQEWRKKKSGGFDVKRTIKDYEFDEKLGREAEVLVDVKIHVFGGSENSQLNDLVFEKNDEGEFLHNDEGHYVPKPDPDDTLGEIALVAVSVGLDIEDARSLREDKSKRFWNSLALECARFNGTNKAEVTAEKNGGELGH